jgi:hypothetical protein
MRRITAGLLIACLPFAASSHHSVKAFYDDQNVTQLEGNIASIRWINPHIHFEVERINDSGETEVWDVESGSVNFLERDGVSRDDMTVGTRVTVTGYSSRHGNHTMVASYVTLENGEDIVLWPGLFGEPRLFPTRSTMAREACFASGASDPTPQAVTAPFSNFPCGQRHSPRKPNTTH